MNRTTTAAIIAHRGRALAATIFATFALPTVVLAQPIPGKEVHVSKARDLPFCEIVPVIGKPPDVMAQFYNTTGASDCPPKKFTAINPKKLAEELHADSVFLNPRRNWVFDQVWVFEVGETRDFDGVKATWMASMSPEVLKAGTKGPFSPMEIHRQSKYLFLKGNLAFLMRTPDGKTYVMQSYTNDVDKSLTLKGLPKVGSQLKLPPGWKFEVKKLDRDLTVDPRKADGVAHIIQDNLLNTYEGCGFDAACDYVP
jgi:hypothetical protein